METLSSDSKKVYDFRPLKIKAAPHDSESEKTYEKIFGKKKTWWEERDERKSETKE
jgi:hypothetical protein